MSDSDAAKLIAGVDPNQLGNLVYEELTRRIKDLRKEQQGIRADLMSAAFQLKTEHDSLTPNERDELVSRVTSQEGRIAAAEGEEKRLRDRLAKYAGFQAEATKTRVGGLRQQQMGT